MSQTNDGYHLACHLAEEGNQVFFWLKPSQTYRNIGLGRNNPQRIQSWQAFVDRCDFVIFDMTGMGKIADQIRKRKPVVGGAEICDKIELDRNLGQKIMEECGNKENYVDISKHALFTNIREGVAFLKKEKDPYVFKALDNNDKVWTFVAEGTNDGLIEYLENQKQKNIKFILQKCVDGIEISTEGWMNGTHFLPTFSHTIEKKRFMNGNRGQNTGCQGSIVWCCGEDEIIRNALYPIEKTLAEHDYHGPVDVNIIASNDKLWFLEFTPRFGYCAIENLWHLINGDKTEFFYGIATGKIREQEFTDDYSMAVVMSFPPYPDYDDIKKVSALEGMKVLNVSNANPENIWLHDAMWNKKKEPVLAGAIGYIGAVVETGKTIEEADKKVYKTIKDIALMKEVQYRTDISEGVEDDIKKLRGWI
jgi:phosphoribosylamine--glycine ligase